MNRLIPAVAALIFMVGASCARQQWHTASGYVWGTTYHVRYLADRNLDDSVVAVADSVSESLSMFSPTSTVARVNRNESDTVDSRFKEVYELSVRVNRASGGRFDPTVAPLTDLWGFGRRGRSEEIPDSAAVASALSKVGITKSRIVADRLIKPDSMEFDFSAVAKGYGVDCVAAMLRRNGSENFMVEIGGEIVLAGHNPAGSFWKIQIDAPVVGSEPGDSALTVLELTDCAIATSGNYRNFRSTDSLGHTINPLTGYPAPKEILSATVIASSCAVADALATALMASPRAVSDSLIAPFGAKAILY